MYYQLKGILEVFLGSLNVHDNSDRIKRVEKAKHTSLHRTLARATQYVGGKRKEFIVTVITCLFRTLKITSVTSDVMRQGAACCL